MEDTQDLRNITAPPTPSDYLVEVVNIKLGDLFVDHQYQRAVSRGRVKYLVQNWTWRRYFPVIIALRGDRYAVIDGQQRFMAMQELGIKEAPAILVVSSSLEDEAELFLGANTAKPVSAGDRFRARIVIKEEKALKIVQLVELYGFRLGCLLREPNANGGTAFKDPFTIDSIAAVERVYDQGYLAQVLDTIAKCWGASPQKEMVISESLTGMYLALRHLSRYEGTSDELVRKMQQQTLMPSEVAERAGQRYKSMVGTKSVPGAYASVLIDVFNFRRQQTIPPLTKEATRAFGQEKTGNLIPGALKGTRMALVGGKRTYSKAE